MKRIKLIVDEEIQVEHLFEVEDEFDIGDDEEVEALYLDLDHAKADSYSVTERWIQAKEIKS